MKEFIICAAIHYDYPSIHTEQPINITNGLVITGFRHKNCHFIERIINKPMQDAFKESEIIKGFLTNTNRFVNRQEAYEIAFKADQIIGPNKGYPTNEIGLTSEDLY